MPSQAVRAVTCGRAGAPRRLAAALARPAARPWLIAAGYLLLVALTIPLAVIAYKAMFSSLDLQDDSGFITVSIREFLGGGSLYGDVYSQYGPGLYVFVGGLLDLLGVPLTTDGGRLVNLALWLGSILLTGVVLLRLTRNIVIAAAGLLLAFVVLLADINEPLHPGAAIGFGLLAMVAAVAFSFESRPAAALAIAGASAAALGSLKPNIGAFAFAALALACATTSPALRPKRVAALVPVAVAILPVALLWPHLDDPFTVRQCVLAVAGIVALSLVAYTVGCEARPDRRDIVWAAIGTVAVLVFVSLVPILRGTSPSELIDGWLVAPSGTTGTFGPIPAYAWVLIWAPLGVVAAAVVAWWTRTGPPLGERARLLVGVAMVVLGLAIWIALSTPILIRSHTLSEVARGLMVATPFAWVVAVRLRDGPRHPVFLTVLIAALAVLQTLHAYPVAGSQVAWSQILFVIVGGMAIAAGSRAIAAAGAAAYPRMPAWRLLAGIAVVAFGAWLVARPIGDISTDYGDAYARGVAPELAGAGRMRLDPERARTLETVTGVLRRNCSTFISIPALNSFYLWSGEPVPTVLSGPWPYLLDDESQQQALDRIENRAGLCLIRDPELLSFWRGFSPPANDGPLLRFVRERFGTLRDFGGYRVGLETGRTGTVSP